MSVCPFYAPSDLMTRLEREKGELMTRECRKCKKRHLAAPITIVIEVEKNLDDDTDKKTEEIFHELRKYFEEFTPLPSLRNGEDGTPVANLQTISEQWGKSANPYTLHISRRVEYKIKLFIDICKLDVSLLYSRQLCDGLAPILSKSHGMIPDVKVFANDGTLCVQDNVRCTPRRK